MPGQIGETGLLETYTQETILAALEWHGLLSLDTVAYLETEKPYPTGLAKNGYQELLILLLPMLTQN